MKILSIYLVVFACVLGSTIGQTDDTEAPTTGEAAETSLPTEPASSAIASSSDPSEKTTKTEDTTASEPATATSSVKPDTTTPTPTTPPPSVDGKWYVEEDNTTCIRMDMALTFTIQYTTKQNTTSTRFFDLPGTHNLTKAEGHCAKDSKESIVIKWKGIDDWSVTFDFTKKEKQYHCSQILFKFTMTEAQFPDIAAEVPHVTAIHNESIWEVDESNSWQCDTNDSVSGKFYDDKDAVQEMNTKGLQLQAFATGQSLKKDFGDPIPCPADSTVSNIVPIAVGAALAALVVIVLIAYLIGRRRNKRGYESV